MREEELKYRVGSRAELDRIAGALGSPCRIERQRNAYVDTPELDLHRRGILIRVRRFEDRAGALLTVKIAERLEPGFIVAREEEEEIGEAEAAALLAAPKALCDLPDRPLVAEALAAVSPERLAVAGELATLRRIFSVGHGELALDEIDVAGETQFEIELETRDAAGGRAYLEALFARLGIAAWKEVEPKTGRLFRRAGTGAGGRAP